MRLTLFGGNRIGSAQVDVASMPLLGRELDRNIYYSLHTLTNGFAGWKTGFDDDQVRLRHPMTAAAFFAVLQLQDDIGKSDHQNDLKLDTVNNGDK